MDGVHMRRMWMMNNPVALVRAMLDPATMLSTPRRLNGGDRIDITLKQGDKLSAAFGADGRPAWVRWAHPQTNLGQANLTTFFTGWSDTAGVMMPLGYQTRLDWRNIDFFKLYVDAYEVDTNIPNLAAPAAVRNAPEPPSYAVQPPTSKPVAQGDLADQQRHQRHRVQGSPGAVRIGCQRRGQAKAVIDHARSLVPGKPVTHLIVSHHHFDHTAGFREAVAEGLTIVQRPASGSIFARWSPIGRPIFPDDLARTRNR